MTPGIPVESRIQSYLETVFRNRNELTETNHEGEYLRKFARIAAVCALGVWALGWSASFVSAQQVDVMVGGGTLFSSTPVTATQNQPVIAEKGAPYPSVGGDVILYERFGLNFEGAWRWKEGVYPGYDQTYRPILLDVNALFQPRLSKKYGADIMVGVGAAFDFHTGRVKDAPQWIKHAGLQWAHRLGQEPRRLWKRYLVNNPAFLFAISLQLSGLRRHLLPPSSRSPSGRLPVDPGPVIRDAQEDSTFTPGD